MSSLQSKSQDELRQMLMEHGVSAPLDYNHAQLVEELEVTNYSCQVQTKTEFFKA